MLRSLRRTLLRAARANGVFQMIADSNWRRQRLLILCYHGISRRDEHLWRPSMYMAPDVFRSRMELLKGGGYNVVPLAEGLERLRTGTLPNRAVAITFDDGGYDFYEKAYPLLKQYQFPATVYQTTYYSDHQIPVFNLICSYMLWLRRDRVLPSGEKVGISGALDLRSEQSRFQIVRDLVIKAEDENLSGLQKDARARQLSELLALNYDDLLKDRTLFLMSRQEVEEVARDGFDIQLHTHRHRTPVDEALFRREVRDNRTSLPNAGAGAVHFCYPSGVYRQEFLPWLSAEKVISATTCDAGLATRDSDPLLLPRLVDTAARSPIEFESWLCGLGSLLAFRKQAKRKVPAAAGRASQLD